MKNSAKEIKVDTFFSLFLNLGFKTISKLTLRRLLSINHYYILKNNLTSLNIEKRRRCNGEIKIIDKDDIDYIIKTAKMLDTLDRQEVISRILF